MGINDIPATELIEAVAQDLKGKIQEPNWIDFVKSGRHRERAPHRRDWFYVRMASILYRINKNGILGTNRLRSYYGGRKNRGLKPHRFYKASGKIIRTMLQQLEKVDYIQKAKKDSMGRIISPAGQAVLDNTANQLLGKSKPKAAPAKKAEVKKETPEVEETKMGGKK